MAPQVKRLEAALREAQESSTSLRQVCRGLCGLQARIGMHACRCVCVWGGVLCKAHTRLQYMWWRAPRVSVSVSVSFCVCVCVFLCLFVFVSVSVSVSVPVHVSLHVSLHATVR